MEVYVQSMLETILRRGGRLVAEPSHGRKFGVGIYLGDEDNPDYSGAAVAADFNVAVRNALIELQGDMRDDYRADALAEDGLAIYNAFIRAFQL